MYQYCSGKLKQEMVRNDPLDMQPYGMILGTHRQPNKVMDKLLHTDEANHIIIISNNHVSMTTYMNEKISIYTHSIYYSFLNFVSSIKLAF